MNANEIAERLTGYTGVGWIRHIQLGAARCYVEPPEWGPDSEVHYWEVAPEYPATYAAARVEEGETRKVEGEPAPEAALDELCDRLGFGPADEVEGGEPPTLVLDPEDGEALRIGSDEAPVKLMPDKGKLANDRQPTEHEIRDDTLAPYTTVTRVSDHYAWRIGAGVGQFVGGEERGVLLVPDRSGPQHLTLDGIRYTVRLEHDDRVIPKDSGDSPIRTYEGHITDLGEESVRVRFGRPGGDEVRRIPYRYFPRTAIGLGDPVEVHFDQSGDLQRVELAREHWAQEEIDAAEDRAKRWGALFDDDPPEGATVDEWRDCYGWGPDGPGGPDRSQEATGERPPSVEEVERPYKRCLYPCVCDEPNGGEACELPCHGQSWGSDTDDADSDTHTQEDEIRKALRSMRGDLAAEIRETARQAQGPGYVVGLERAAEIVDPREEE